MNMFNEAFLNELVSLLGNWRFYIIFLPSTFLCSVVGAYVGSRYKKKGEIDTVDANLEKILRQLEKTTEVAEQVRSKVDHADWVAREWKTIRRVKLEELVQSALSVNKWVAQQTTAWMVATDEEYNQNQEVKQKTCPAEHVQILTMLYFPDELEEQSKKLMKASGAILEWYQNTSSDIRRKIPEGKERVDRWNALVKPEWHKHYDDVKDAIVELKKEASEIMRKERDGMITTNTGE